MAEEEGLTDQEIIFDNEERHPKKENRQREEKPVKNKCRSRIDQLALPSRRIILDLYQNHAHHLEKERQKNIKTLLQELYAMTPEETERYFATLRQKNEEISRRKNIKFMLKKLVKKRNKDRSQRKAYESILYLLTLGMRHAVTHPVPPLVSIRLRYLSDIVLEQLCDLRNIDIPSREYPDQVGAFFIAVADWLAIVIEYLYFRAQIKKNTEQDNIERDFKEKEIKSIDTKQELKEKEVIKKSEEAAVEKDMIYDEGILSEPLLVSEME